MNPDEQVWNYAKREVGKKIIRSKDEMEKTILSVMSTIKKSAKLIRSFFRMPDTKYA
ncbi:MAG: IS630 family transposase, partial [Gammaproteobacteria bacterium]|nr:IS630 family transposase [Gammaproteobacteria bacterium]